MTIQQLKYAIAVAEKNSISEAAKSLYISQPSLSAAIAELESKLRIPIFIRTNRGVAVTPEGEEFLGYARQVMEQVNLLEQKYASAGSRKQKFSVSSQHYSFAVEAFVGLLKEYGFGEYDFTLRETRTHEIIEDVRTFKSQLGVIYLSAFNEKVLKKLLDESGLVFEPLFSADPHIFVSRANPLAQQKSVKPSDLAEYPRLSFEQGEYNSFYFSEELLSTAEAKKSIKVSDRATLFNLLIGMDGYTICTGILSEQLDGGNIVSVPLDIDDKMTVGYISHAGVPLSRVAAAYVEALKRRIGR